MKTIKHIDTWSIVIKLVHNIYIKVEDHIETNVNDYITNVLYTNDEIDRLEEVQRQIRDFFKSSHED
jgi:hypothetical protein